MAAIVLGRGNLKSFLSTVRDATMKALIPVTLACTLQFVTALADDQSPGAQLLATGQTSQPVEQEASPPPADSPADGTLHLQGGSLAAGIGYVWGKGTLSYQGADHKFSINGVSVVDVGGAKIDATGAVMHLSTLQDFEGTYTAWGAGLTIAGGGSAVYMKNERGVVIKLLSETTGLRFNLSGNGIKVRLKN
jgi:hypothetical protein